MIATIQKYFRRWEDEIIGWASCAFGVVIIVILLGLAYIPEWTIPAIAVATLILAIAQWP